MVGGTTKEVTWDILASIFYMVAGALLLSNRIHGLSWAMVGCFSSAFFIGTQVCWIAVDETARHGSLGILSYALLIGSFAFYSWMTYYLAKKLSRTWR